MFAQLILFGKLFGRTSAGASSYSDSDMSANTKETQKKEQEAFVKIFGSKTASGNPEAELKVLDEILAASADDGTRIA